MAKITFSHACLHQSAFVEGYGDIGRTMPPVNKTLQDWVMHEHDTGIVVTFTNPKTNSTTAFVVPWANVVTATISTHK
jgi:hypothetical protein